MNYLLVWLVFATIGAQAVYDDGLSRTFYILSAAAHAAVPQPCLNNHFTDITIVGQRVVDCDFLNMTNSTTGPILCSAYVALNNDNSSIVIAFRGSIGYAQVKEEELATILKNQSLYVDHRSLITGHSLGAAMSALAAGYLINYGYVTPDNVKLINFGMPRTGDSNFSTYIDNNVPYKYRVVHRNDPVPHSIPQEFVGFAGTQYYTHISNEIWYNNSMEEGAPWIECDQNESPMCSDQLETDGTNFTLFGLDHLMYFNIDISDYATNACLCTADGNYCTSGVQCCSGLCFNTECR
uniref:Fungal lipase-like domain-containing protein n=1 Tax=Acrobeloides nanus TaxID=290746 RepID=A0A914CD65_9BILA